MKIKNIPIEIRCKSLKESKEEISDILNKLEKKDVDLESSINDYQRLIQLNNHVESLFKLKVKSISVINKNLNLKNDK